MRKRDDLRSKFNDRHDVTGKSDKPHVANSKAPIGASGQISMGVRLRCSLGWRLGRLKDWLFRQVEKEQKYRGGFLWVPVLLGAGSLLYFHLPREPWTMAFPAAAIGFALATLRGRKPALRIWFASLTLVALGVCLAQWRVARTDTNLLERHRITEVAGQISRLEIRADDRVRYTLRVHTLDQKEPWPQKVRLTSRKGSSVYAIGDVISGRARLGPPPGPALPGGYDFRFFAWFDGIGGSGFFLGHPQLVGHNQHTQDFSAHINAIRHQIGLILRTALPEQTSALATALIVGDRSGIDESTSEALRRSGLAHILAISGLHMALVSMTVVALVRFIGAFHMNLVSCHSVKKWAGGLGLVFATAYLMLSGASVSTQRAYVMVAIMLIAVMVDRRALTMRNVALAAIVVLVFAPEALFHPGFQMSFAAVAALVSAFEALSSRAAKRIRPPPATRTGLIVLRCRNYLTGLTLVPLIAGLSTGIFAAYHFYRVAPLGLLANLLAMPIVSIAVMPLALAGVVLMPFGLERIALAPMGLTLQAVVAIARWVADLGPWGAIGFVPNLTLMSSAVGLMLVTLCRSQLKWLCLVFFAFAATGFVHRPVPDAIIAESGRQVGLLLNGGAMVLSKPNAEKFTTRLWREAYGVEKLKSAAVTMQNVHRRCDRYGCVLKKPGLVIAHIHNTGRLSMDCLQADVLVVPFDVSWACQFLAPEERPLVIDARTLRVHGSHAIYLNARQGHQADNARITHITARPTVNRSWQD